MAYLGLVVGVLLIGAALWAALTKPGRDELDALEADLRSEIANLKARISRL